MNDQQSILRKKILYQSNNRGCKETDLILGQFAKAHLDEMNDQELLIFQQILKLNDADIYDWYTGKKTLPSEYQSVIMLKLMNFKTK